MHLHFLPRFLVVTALLWLSVAGCSAPSPKQDFHDYLLEMSHYGPEEDKMLRLNQKVMGDIETGKTTSTQALRAELLPSIKDLIQKMENVQPKTQEVKELQHINMATTKTFYTGFSSFADGIDKRDETTLKRAMQQIQQGYSQAAAMKSIRDRLIAKYGVPPKLRNAFPSPMVK